MPMEVQVGQLAVFATKKPWVVFAVVAVVFLFSTGTEWNELSPEGGRTRSKVHAVKHLAMPRNDSGDPTADHVVPNITSSALSSSAAPAIGVTRSSDELTATTSTQIPSTVPAEPSTKPGRHEHVAIVTYVPAGHVKFVNQTVHMLWSSWNHSIHQVDATTRGRTDLVLFAHRDVIDAMPPSCSRVANFTEVRDPRSTDGCVVVEHTPAADDYWHRYSFMFSLSFLAEPRFQPLLLSYDRLLRTDSDVVVTPAFLTFRPRQFVVGRGGYMTEEYTKTRIKQVAADLNMTHQSLYNVGSTWFGNATLTLEMIPKMLQVAKYILDSPKYSVDEGFPRWHVGVTSMYAGELVVNHFIPKDDVWVNMDSLDINCNGLEKTADVYHSHCWPGDQYLGHFNKWAYERGEYTPKRFPRESLNVSVINDYFVAMVLYGY